MGREEPRRLKVVEMGGRGVPWELEARILATAGERLRGLLGTGPEEGAVLLARCKSVHTFGMGYPLDLAFVDGAGVVLLSKRGVPPWRVVSCAEAACVLERPSSDKKWPQEGDRVDGMWSRWSKPPR